MQDEEKQYRIGELSRITGVSRRTIDFYTRIGLLMAEDRSEGNYRIYNQECLERLAYIHEMKAKKFSLEEIKARLDEAREHLSDPNHLLERVHKLQEDLLTIEREVTSMKPELVNAIQLGVQSDVNTSIKRALAQGLSLAQAILLLLDPSIFTNNM
ncbi:MAG: transcriptional regulator, MerR family [Bacilli bacterium]|nr:transcriptional regulator, MerR family [Bacilli bacterium]